jgi:hypothetical protein
MANPFSNKFKPIVMQLMLFTTIGLVGWFGVRLLFLTIQEKMDDIQKLSVTREHREKQLERLPDLEAQHMLIREHEDRLGIILTKDRIVEFIQEIEQLAQDEDVAVEIESRDNAFLESKVTPVEKKDAPAKSTATPTEKAEAAAEPVKKGPASKETGIVTELPLKKYLKLTITVTGEYGDAIRFLHRLETLPYALDVIGLNMKQRAEDADLIANASAAFNPFAGEIGAEAFPAVSRVNVLEAVFETVVYMKD